MVTEADISWGKYREYEGPWFKGTKPFELSDNPTDQERILAVITATEGGKYDAYNGYDRCISTAGLIQWCEAGMYGVSSLLGYIVEKAGSLAPIQSVEKLCTQSGVTFGKNAKGRYRFFFKDGRGEVDTLQEQQSLFLLRSNGVQGSWDEASKEYARRWAAAIVTALMHPLAMRPQVLFTVERVLGFMLPNAVEFFAKADQSNLHLALRAAYLSFAANNPRRASEDLAVALNTVGRAPLTPEVAREILRCLTFNSGVVIYPGRYEKIRPVLERLYRVDLPDMAAELKEAAVYRWETLELQRALAALGYDLGPRGADGAWGTKSTTALINFQESAKIPVTDGRTITRDTTDALSMALVSKGLTRADLTAAAA